MKRKKVTTKRAHEIPSSRIRVASTIKSTSGRIVQTIPTTKLRGRERGQFYGIYETKTSFVRFKPEVEEIESSDEDESKTSLGELWAIDAKTKIKIESNLEEDSHLHSNQLHPITIMSFPDTSGGRLVCTALADQCCTRKRLIAHDLADALGCGITESAETTIYKTAGGNFESRSEISIPDAMLPCFTAQRSFKVVFNVMPKEVSIDATYGVIIGQDTMRQLKIDTSVLTNSITWDNLTTPMVP